SPRVPWASFSLKNRQWPNFESRDPLRTASLDQMYLTATMRPSGLQNPGAFVVTSPRDVRFGGRTAKTARSHMRQAKRTISQSDIVPVCDEAHMSIIHVNQIKNRVVALFDGKIDLTDIDKGKISKGDLESQFLTRALAAYAIHVKGHVEVDTA